MLIGSEQLYADTSGLRFGSWKMYATDTSSDIFGIAATLSDNYDMLAMSCSIYKNNCNWTFTSKNIACENRQTVPIFIISNNRSVQLQTICTGNFYSEGNRLWNYIFTNFDAIDDIIKKDRTMIFIVPYNRSSNTYEIRFDLNGSVQAISAVGRLRRLVEDLDNN